jgi:hypothetical protein
MAALSANRPTDRFGGIDGSPFPNRIPVPIAAAVHIYQGAMVQLNASGQAQPAATGSGGLIVGRAYEEYDNTTDGVIVGAGAAGFMTVEVEQGAFLWDLDTVAPPAQVNVGAVVYAVDDHTVSTSNAGTRGSAGRLLALITVPEWGVQAAVQTIFGIA